MTADQTRIKCGVSPRRGDLFVATVTLLQAIKSPTHHPRIIIFSVTHGTGFVNLFMSESDILGALVKCCTARINYGNNRAF
jgi:hypothetical protein